MPDSNEREPRPTSRRPSTDLTSTPGHTTDSIVSLLTRRCDLDGAPFTQIGTRVMVALNAYPQSHSVFDHRDRYRDHFIGMRNDPGHLYNLVNLTLFHLRRTGSNQVVIFMGDSGAGKTLTRNQFVDQLGYLKAKNKKETKLIKQLNYTSTVYQSFGSAFTSASPSTSKVGLYTELQCLPNGQCQGFRTLDYLLDTHLVTRRSPTRSNFLVFHQLLAGTSNQEKDLFHLTSNPQDYEYLKGTTPSVTNSQLEEDFRQLKGALRSIGFQTTFQNQIFQLLASILCLGNIQFIQNQSQQPTNQAAITVTNQASSALVAELLGLHTETLESLLTYKTQFVKKEKCTVFLNGDGARLQRDQLARCLYGLLFSWLLEHINSHFSAPVATPFIGMLDLPGPAVTHQAAKLHNFCINYSNERLYHYMSYHIYEVQPQDLPQSDIHPHYQDNQMVIQLFDDKHKGLIPILHKQANRAKGPASDAIVLQKMNQAYDHDNATLFQVNPSMSQFIISHYFASITYSVNGFMDDNIARVSPDFVQVFRDQSDTSVNNPFITGLFSNDAIVMDTPSQDQGTAVEAHQTNMPTRKPTTRRSRPLGQVTKSRVTCVTSQLKSAMDDLFDAFDEAEVWFVLCLRSHLQVLKEQVQRYQLVTMVERQQLEYTSYLTPEDFLTRYQPILHGTPASYHDMVEEVRHQFEYHPHQLMLGSEWIYITHETWFDLETRLERSDHLEDDVYSTSKSDDTQTVISTEMEDFALARAETGFPREEEKEPLLDSPPTTRVRKTWVCCTWALTWWIPGICLSKWGRMKQPDIRMAWREKVALCIIIFLLCLLALGFLMILGPLICPTRHIYSPGEVSVQDPDKTVLSHLYGSVYNLAAYDGFKQNHHDAPRSLIMDDFGGKDLSEVFPQQISSLCKFHDGSEINPQVQLTNTSRTLELTRHDHRYFRSTDSDYQPGWLQYVVKNRLAKVRVGQVAYEPKFVKSQSFAANPRMWVIYREPGDRATQGKIWDITSYSRSLLIPRYNEKRGSYSDVKFLHPDFISLVASLKGQDVTDAFNNNLLPGEENRKTKAILKSCLDNAFFAGVVDDRNSTPCQIAQYSLLTVSILLSLVMLVKFLTSLQLGTRPAPEDHDKFVICNVPCYTEGIESLKLTIDSLAALKYDDKRKLLFIVSDGMVVGGGNDDPTPLIVLRLLGADPELDPEPLSFLSLGEGNKQHNRGKVYTGLYHCRGHVVPYLVVVKVGTNSERSKPGNRGKRDSQMILMRFFNKVFYNHPLVPLELEMYHQIKNVIGVDPHFYEMVLMVDADTQVLPDSLNRLVSSLAHDSSVMAVCGETALLNEKATWSTMIQVYKYYLSHYLAKSFESLFGSVTCLPGCFSLYRLQSSDRVKPFLIHKQIISDYSQNRVETLHTKNLLHLGEDRYLTTLILKQFPYCKLKFTPDAKCLTNAPDTFAVLLSQRRRWINSTVHNLMELVWLPQLCGFCCFSMRFVVFLDLFSMVVMPATLFYLGYLLYRLITDSRKLISVFSIGFLVLPYALQMVVFLIRRKWQHIGWMVFYLCSLPMFAFFIPLYSFWHFDDFSWGNTRVVLGERGKTSRQSVKPEYFDPDTIPTMHWDEYEATLRHTPDYGSDATAVRSRTGSPMPYDKSPSGSPMPYDNFRSQSPFTYTQPQSQPPFTNNQSQASMPIPTPHPAAPGYPPLPYTGANSLAPSPLPYAGPSHSAWSSSSLLAPTPPPLFPSYQPHASDPPASDLVAYLRTCLDHADLNTVTPRQLRSQINDHYHSDVATRHHQFVQATIESLLASRHRTPSPHHPPPTPQPPYLPPP